MPNSTTVRGSPAVSAVFIDVTDRNVYLRQEKDDGGEECIVIPISYVKSLVNTLLDVISE